MEDVSLVRSVAFYRSFHDAASMLDDGMRLLFFDAIRNYAFEGIVPQIPDGEEFDMLRMAWTLAEPNLRTSMENSANGAKGGRGRKKPDPEP